MSRNMWALGKGSREALLRWCLGVMQIDGSEHQAKRYRKDTSGKTIL